MLAVLSVYARNFPIDKTFSGKNAGDFLHLPDVKKLFSISLNDCGNFGIG